MLEKPWKRLELACRGRMNPSLPMIRFYPERKNGLSERKDPQSQSPDHEKTIVYGVLSLDGKQLFRQQNERFDSQTFIGYLDHVRKKFKKFSIFFVLISVCSTIPD